MAPEILDNSDPSTEADVWAFGMTTLVCMLFITRVYGLIESSQELFTRKTPFRRSPVDVLSKIRGEQLVDRPSDEETCSRMTDQWWDICLSCWNRTLSRRPTMTDIVKKIEEMVYFPNMTLRRSLSINLHR